MYIDLRVFVSVACISWMSSTASSQSLLVSVFDKAVPETNRDLLTIQHRAIDIARRAAPCTVGLEVGHAMGSGVVISPDGYVLTAAHVVMRPGSKVLVKFPDGTEAQGVTLGMHTAADGALVKITDEGSWPFVPFAQEGEDPRVGDWCLAMGHPGGFDVSRSPPVRVGRIVDVTPTILRTDCPITSGDSGGPLFDMEGRVIGVHSRITESLTENYHVPGSAIRDAWSSLINSELYPKPIQSQFLAALDSNADGKLTAEEMQSDYHRRVFERLVHQFALDPEQPIVIDDVAKEKFKWRVVTQARLDQIHELPELGDITLPSSDFVRGPKLTRLFQSELRHADKVTVRVYADGRRVALGTIVDADGLVLTKASRLDHEDITCLLPSGQLVVADIVASDDDYDLAVLHVDAKELTTPDWVASTIEPGSWVMIPNTGGRLASLGVVAVAPREIQAKAALLGIQVDQEIITEAVVQSVGGRSGAAKAGIMAGDVVVEVAGRPVTSAKDIQQVLRGHPAGTSVRTVIRRDQRRFELDVTLSQRSDLDFDPINEAPNIRRALRQEQLERRRLEGRRSRRRAGFKSAFQMDAVLKPELCGGPVVDARGRIVGVTLARADRVASYAVTFEDLQPVLRKLLARAQTSVSKPADSVERQ